MRIISRVAASVQSLFGAWAEAVNLESPAVVRRRKFSASTLARTFVLGYMNKRHPSVRDLAEMAALCGARVSPQAIEQRFTPALAHFLEQVFRRGLQHLVSVNTPMAPLLKRFASVVILDSTTIRLPNEMKNRFPGCGGATQSCQAAMKLQVQWDLRSGGLPEVAIESGRECDYKTPVLSAPQASGSLIITDLGYFSISVFQERSRAGAYWLSRLAYKTTVFNSEGNRLNLLQWLARQKQTEIDVAVTIGIAERAPCRLLAWRVPRKVALLRKKRLIAATKKKGHPSPGPERLAWCDWMLLVTNVPIALLSAMEGLALYRARWQIELLFKRWKSQGFVAECTNENTTEQMVRLWARLIGVLLEHWLILSTAWGNATLSLVKASKIIRNHINLLAPAITSPRHLTSVIRSLRETVQTIARRNKRKRPSTFEILNKPELIRLLT